MNLRISRIIKDSTIDGPGKRFVIFTQGCYHNCPGCNSSQTHDPTGGKNIGTDEILKQIEEVSNDINGITFSGGEPFNQAEALAVLGRKIKNKYENLDIITYTGYTFEEINDEIQNGSLSLDWLRLLTISDYLIDGPYITDKKSTDNNCIYRGSTNQRYLDCQKSFILKSPIEVEEYKYIESEENEKEKSNT